MTDRRTDRSLQELGRGTLVEVFALVVVGSVLAVIGFALSGVAVVIDGRHRYYRADLPPRQLARLK
jgi:hypothetical protein